MKYHLITYGCQMNTADSEEMAQPLKGRGFIQTPDVGRADVVIMNTCTVRDQAEHRADSNLGRLREWKEQKPERVLIVAGCAATRWGDSIQKKYPFIDAVSPATKIEQFPELIQTIFKDRWDGQKETVLAAPELPTPHSLLPTDSGNWFGDERTGYVTIMRGCNYSCSYCIVPQVRGREVYRAMPEILNDVRQKVAEGYKDIMLLGQTVNSYVWRNGAVHQFEDLIKAVDQIEGVETIRFMSPHPKHMRSKQIEALGSCKKLSKHIHLPLQSGSTRLLERMKRLYTREEYLTILQQLRSTIPGIHITTDVIVGFPGETDSDFEATLSIIREARFKGVFVFKYSPRPGTVSAGWPDDVSDAAKEDRLQRALTLAKELGN